MKILFLFAFLFASLGEGRSRSVSLRDVANDLVLVDASTIVLHADVEWQLDDSNDPFEFFSAILTPPEQRVETILAAYLSSRCAGSHLHTRSRAPPFPDLFV